MNNPKFILWDNDGVLVDTENWYYQANKKALSELSIDLTFEQYMQIMQDGKSAWELARQKGISEDELQKHRQARNNYYQQYLLTEDIGIPGVKEVLETLSKKYSMAIVTTSKKADFDLIHKDRSLLKYMDFVLTRNDYEKSKPNPEPYLMALKQFGATADDAIVIEDSTRGLNSAIAAGIPCVIVKNEFTKTHDFTGATKMIDCLADLLDFL